MVSNSGFGAKAVLDKLSVLSDEAVVRSLELVLGRRRRDDALVIAHLSEVHERRLHLQSGCSSLTGYCVEVLGMSEDEAGLRVAVAHLVRRIPAALACLADGRLHLSGLLCLKPHLTSDNAQELLSRASGGTKREIKELVASLAPKPDAVALVRRESGPRPALARMAPLGPAPSNPTTATPSRSGSGSGSDSGSDSGSGPGSGPAPASRAIPAAVRRAVVERDGEQCSFVAAPEHGGRRCTETANLEFHHEVPFARGGDHAVDNVHLRCRAHNIYEAERDYGREVMDRYSSNRNTEAKSKTRNPGQT